MGTFTMSRAAFPALRRSSLPGGPSVVSISATLQYGATWWQVGVRRACVRQQGHWAGSLGRAKQRCRTLFWKLAGELGRVLVGREVQGFVRTRPLIGPTRYRIAVPRVFCPANITLCIMATSSVPLAHWPHTLQYGKAVVPYTPSSSSPSMPHARPTRPPPRLPWTLSRARWPWSGGSTASGSTGWRPGPLRERQVGCRALHDMWVTQHCVRVNGVAMGPIEGTAGGRGCW